MHIRIPIDVPEIAELRAALITAVTGTTANLRADILTALQQMQQAQANRHTQIANAIERIATMAQLTQADIDTLSNQLGTINDTLTAGIEGLTADIEDLKAQDVDTSALESRVADLQAAADALSGLDAQNPVPAPEPTPGG